MKRIFEITIFFFLLVPIYGQAACSIVNGTTYGNCGGVGVGVGAGAGFGFGLKGIMTITRSKSESGNIAGAKVLSGGALFFSGVSMGDIVVTKGGRLVVTGVVNGAVRNNGGAVSIRGVVNTLVVNGGKTVIYGTVSSASGAGEVFYKEGSVVGYSTVKKSR
ncbi:hypothetical protein MNBD_GAMMA12-1962 [hydrothermal vent metagenome]|uniref:Uncharacterized protein n=1 Tax=hydrothermal vent metagenome TaxID=652676 RepID=A0A3B0ZKU8_9ZZZZ